MILTHFFHDASSRGNLCNIIIQLEIQIEFFSFIPHTKVEANFTLDSKIPFFIVDNSLTFCFINYFLFVVFFYFHIYGLSLFGKFSYWSIRSLNHTQDINFFSLLRTTQECKIFFAWAP